jgi:NADH-quinone oxidoreductase subunit H
MFFFFEFTYVFVLYIVVILCMLITVAFFTVYERKFLAAAHQRVGPNVVGPFGLLQAIADGVKLFLKEFILPLRANRVLFVFAPMLVFFLSLMSWLVVPFNSGIVVSNISLGVIFILLISSLNVYGIILSGWAGNSRYAFLGALRSAAQMISYELAMSTCILTVVLCSGSLNLTQIVNAQVDVWYFWPLWPIFLIFFICSLAETNRSPFDLPEAESELVSGYNTEHSAFPFAFFFLGEYLSIVLLSNLNVLFFFGGWLPPFNFLQLNPILGFDFNWIWYFIKVFFFLTLFVWVRGSMPRYRYDQLMRLGWKVFLPLTFALFGFSVSFLYTFVGSAPLLF